MNLSSQWGNRELMNNAGIGVSRPSQLKNMLISDLTESKEAAE